MPVHFCRGEEKGKHCIGDDRCTRKLQRTLNPVLSRAIPAASVSQFKMSRPIDVQLIKLTPLAVAAAENNTRVGLARNMASAGGRAYNGGLGAEAPVGVRGQSPPLKLLAF